MIGETREQLAKRLIAEIVAEERAERVAKAIMAIGQGKFQPASMEHLSEYQAEQRHRMVQAQRLKK